mmetsp:Transcript_64151/g.134902  ORF Transcript_64151/g.134902 Transcript_64151/m.134902 type:complete len:201 (-) Transcript_64151:272-874(-)
MRWTARTESHKSSISSSVNSPILPMHRRGTTSMWPGTKGFKFTVAKLRPDVEVKNTWEGFRLNLPNWTASVGNSPPTPRCLAKVRYSLASAAITSSVRASRTSSSGISNSGGLLTSPSIGCQASNISYTRSFLSRSPGLLATTWRQTVFAGCPAAFPSFRAQLKAVPEPPSRSLCWADLPWVPRSSQASSLSSAIRCTGG